MDVTLRAVLTGRLPFAQDNKSEAESIDFDSVMSRFRATSPQGDEAAIFGLHQVHQTETNNREDGEDYFSLERRDAGSAEGNADVDAARNLLSVKRAKGAERRAADQRANAEEGADSSLDQESPHGLKTESIEETNADAISENSAETLSGNPEQAPADELMLLDQQGRFGRGLNMGKQTSGESIGQQVEQELDLEEFAGGKQGRWNEVSAIKSSTISAQAGEQTDLNSEDGGGVISQELIEDGMVEVDYRDGAEFSSRSNKSNSEPQSAEVSVNSSLEAKQVLVASMSKQSHGDTVKLTGKARTMSHLVGNGMGIGKGRMRSDAKVAIMAPPRKPSSDSMELDDVDKLSVMSQISDGLKLNFQGEQTLEVNLNPAELGRVRLQLEMQGDKSLNIKVSAEHAVIAELLSLNLNDLKKELLAQGVQVQEIEVDVEAHGQGAQQQEEQEPNQEQATTDGFDSRADSDEERQFSVQA